ncbi:2Fe-2S ferredoxin-like superfamily protein [Hirschfeldia incana]|nr:2Fe-2S ferredoxin-like superfamily protein [Hirschfeldia incana]
MASLGFNLGFSFSGVRTQKNRQVSSANGRARVISCNSSSSSSSQASPQGISTPPEIELEFFGPKPESDGTYPRDKAKAVSGEKLLRSIMQDNKIELYATYGKVMNCGGGGSCGTCIVEILDGRELLNERTDTENKYLKKKPESWRLACQTIVGNKENSGTVVVQRIPQWKK